jgi:hypothetical protein
LSFFPFHLGPFGLCDYPSRFLAFLVFFSVFSCFSACRYKTVILAFLGFSGPLPCFTSLLCLIWPAVCPVCPSRGCAFSSRGALFVSGREVGPACFRLPVGCRVPVAPSGSVWPC